jgi:hypothetical protein
MSEPTSDPKLAALEKSLSALVPLPGRIDRDQLLYRAGQASARSRTWLWPTTTTFFAVLAAILGSAVAVQTKPTPVERIVYVPIPQPSPSKTDSPSQGDMVLASRANSSRLETDDVRTGSVAYLKELNFAVRWGADALPTPPSMGSSEESPSLESMLGQSEKKEKSAGWFPFKF